MAEQRVPEIPFGFKTCKKCKVEKELSEFRYEPKVKTKTTAKCGVCMRIDQKQWATDHPERVKASREKYNKRFPERILEARNFSVRRIALERREKRIAAGKPLLEPRTTEEGRLCSKCRRRKSEEEFPLNRSTYDGHAVYCKPCAAKDARERQRAETQEQREHKRRYSRRYDIKRNYGIPFETVAALLADQNNQCAICFSQIDLLAKRSGCVDHDHGTKKIRGILCVKCNAGIGQFCEDVNRMESAIRYIKRHRE